MRLFIVIHILISTIYFIFIPKKEKIKNIYQFLVILFVPFFGVLYFILLYTCKRFIKNISASSNTYMESREDEFYHDEDIKLVNRIDIKKEINIVPLEEALALNDNSVKRKMLIDILKEDVDQYIGLLKQALMDDDTETSHYAASAIVEFKGKLALTLQKFEVKYEKDKKDIEILIPYADALKEYLKSGLLDEIDCRKYRYTYVSVLENLLQIYKEEEKYYVNMIECQIELNDFNKAKEYCDLFIGHYEESEAPYLLYLKLYYVLGSSKNFKNTLEALRKSPIRLSNDSLSKIRFWLKEG